MSRRIIAGVISVVSMVTITGNGVAFAQTSTSTLQMLIQQLQAQITQLKTQLETLRSTQSAVRDTQGNIKDTVQLIRELREGSSGDDVKALQALLAADADVYPEGLITGYYGRLTTQAVRKFQKKTGLPEVGHVGPKTLEKIKEQHAQTPVELEDSDDPSEGKRPCAKVPPGHLIAPGWLRKMHGERPIVPPCQILPPGIQKRISGDIGTSTPIDIIAPTILGLIASSTTASSTHIIWNTNEPATSAVWYASSTPVASNSNALTMAGASLITSHDLALTNLMSNTTYYYFVKSADASGNNATSSEQSFTTLL